MKNTITQSQLKSQLHYDQNTGIFTRKISNTNRVKVGDIAGSIMPIGYIEMSIKGKRYLAHRLAWLYMYGAFPKHQIDHINHIRNDNCIENLREATISENRKNQSLSKLNTSGVIGVCWDKFRNKWSAEIRVDGKNIKLGRFNDKQDAIKARKVAEVKYNFHPNHGKGS